MANVASARKRTRQSAKRRLHNMGLRSRMRTHIKNFVKMLAAGDKDAAQAACKRAVSAVDSSVSKGLIHKNKAARHKKRMNRLLQQAE